MPERTCLRDAWNDFQNQVAVIFETNDPQKLYYMELAFLAGVSVALNPSNSRTLIEVYKRDALTRAAELTMKGPPSEDNPTLTWKPYATYGAGYAVKDHRGQTVVTNLSSSDAVKEAFNLAKSQGMNVVIIRDESEDE